MSQSMTRKELRESDAPIIYDDARSLYRGFKNEIETVPYEEERYAEAVIDYDLEELKRLDKEFKCIDNLDDIQNDRNANMIPDDLEDLEEYRVRDIGDFLYGSLFFFAEFQKPYCKVKTNYKEAKS